MGKLGAKLLRRWSSLRLGRPSITMAKEEEEEDENEQEQEKEKNVRRPSGLVAMDDPDYDESVKVQVPQGFTMVYVGKCRRRFLIKSQYVQHPLLAQLTQRQRQRQPHNDGAAVLLSCEVVLFQYLVWMLETSDPQSESLQKPDFAHLYASD